MQSHLANFDIKSNIFYILLELDRHAPFHQNEDYKVSKDIFTLWNQTCLIYFISSAMKQMYTRKVGLFPLTTSKLSKNTSCCSQIRPERITWFFQAEQNKNIQMFADALFCIWQIFSRRSSDQHIHLFRFWRFLLLYKVAPLQKRLQFLNCSHTLSLGFRWKIKSVRDPHIGFGKLQVATSKS